MCSSSVEFRIARQVDRSEDATGIGIAYGHRRARYLDQGFGKVVRSVHHRFSPLGDRRADRVRADGLFAVQEPRCELNTIEQIFDHTVTWSPDEHLTSLIGQKQRHWRAPEVVRYAVYDGTGGPAESPILVYV
jgi:hypothetical protein